MKRILLAALVLLLTCLPTRAQNGDSGARRQTESQIGPDEAAGEEGEAPYAPGRDSPAESVPNRTTGAAPPDQQKGEKTAQGQPTGVGMHSAASATRDRIDRL